MQLHAELLPLAERYDVVVANPPYMGSSSLGKWNGKWIKDSFPEAYRDLCTSFIDRGFTLSSDQGYSAMVTMQSWMFLGSYEKLRGKLLRNHTISSMAHLGTRAFGAIGGEVVSTTATVFVNKKHDMPGTYLRLVDMGSEQEKAAGALEALANPDCSWRYRAEANQFELIPGNPIAYWASNSMIKAFESFPCLQDFATPRQGLATSNNSRFLRKWWEVSTSNTDRKCRSHEEALECGARWFPIIRGGAYQKWFGVYDEVVDWADNGREMKAEVLRKYTYLNTPDFVIKNQADYFKPAVTWSKISSGDISFRYAPAGMLFEVAGACMFAEEDTLCAIQAFCNSSIALEALSFLAPTLNYEIGQISILPISEAVFEMKESLCEIVGENRILTQIDLSKEECSSEFKKHPLV